jgi:hypothetical protein
MSNEKEMLAMLLAYLQARFDALPPGTVLVAPATCAVCETGPCNAVNHNFGVCPICHKTDGYLNVGNDYWFVCNEHKTKWVVGANLFSSCMDETPEQQRADQEKIGFAGYEKVAAHYDTTEADEECDGCPCFRCENSDVKEVQFGDPELMDYCAICGTAPCNADNPKNIAYFGVCPQCHRTDGYICVGVNKDDQEIGKIAVLLCRAHKTCWSAGYKTFSSWRDETVEEQTALQSALGFWTDYEKVKPVYCSQEGMESGCIFVSVHCITAEDLTIERTVDKHQE